MAYAYLGGSTGLLDSSGLAVQSIVGVVYSAGDTLSLWAAMVDYAGGAVSMSDGTNTYTKVGGIAGMSGNDMALFECISPTPGTYTVTVTWTNAGADHWLFHLGRYSGTATRQAGALTDTIAVSTVGTDALTSTAFTPAAQPALIVGVCVNAFNISVAAGTGYTNRIDVAPGGGGHAQLEDKRVTATSAVNTTWTDSTTTARALFTVGYNETGGGGGGTSSSRKRVSLNFGPSLGVN